MKSFFVAGFFLSVYMHGFGQIKKDYPIHPVPFTSVKVTGEFWQQRLETNRTVTLPFDFQKCEETGRISNFEKAAGMKQGAFEGIRFNDSDVYKIMEGAAYSLSIHPDPELDKYMDDLIAKIAGAQEPDGYLYTARTIDPKNLPGATGPERWSYLDQSHELYNVGHMYEAAVAHFLATGKRNFLNVAIKNADLIAQTFGPDKQYGVPGHEEIEIGLVKLYRVTGDIKYLNLAKYFLDTRGRRVEGAKYPQKLAAYDQNEKPVTELDKIEGHAVRAMYLYSAMADVAALTDDQQYIDALDRLWNDLANKKLYLTGGIGARRSGESFGDDYELPNESAYNETCAAIGNMLWNERMFLLKGEAKYFDVLERTLYNGFLSGVSLQGNTFFYPNPLACDGRDAFNQGVLGRKAWFDCSCCPTNVVRFLPSLPGYIYATKGDALYVNLYIGNEATINMMDKKLQITQHTNYPWDGKVNITLNPTGASSFKLLLRIPGWTQNNPVPGDLYRYVDNTPNHYNILVNGKQIHYQLENGYATIDRKWKKGDLVQLELTMNVRYVKANPKVEADLNRIAIERGPIVYCAEAVDNQGQISNIIFDMNKHCQTMMQPDLLGGIEQIKTQAVAFIVSEEGHEIHSATQSFTIIPYYAWAHRQVGEMAVWLPEKANSINIVTSE